MKKILLALFALFAIVLVYAQTSSNNEPAKKDIKIESAVQAVKGENHPPTNNNCRSCHVCDVPTKEDPCLIICPRDPEDPPTGDGPDMVMIDRLQNKYLPVNFSHKTHAQMSEMHGGCENCHHFNTVGPIKKCAECHSETRKRQDLGKPDLQAAYHRQCINCHKEWSHDTECNACHGDAGSSFNQKEYKPVNHPVVNQPEKLVYKTNHKKGKLVTFYHNQHVSLFKTDCRSCHEQESCTRCHDKNQGGAKLTNIHQLNSKSESERHRPCFKCHANDDCGKCHLNREKGPFSHDISTNFALGARHGHLSCEKCHTSGKLNKINSNCTSCHKDFVSGKFNHDRTGFRLDEIHSALDCGDCHASGKFSTKVECATCHEKSYPKDKPGKAIKIVKK